ncbi:MAG TPA: glycogen synthase GlgA [Blastocatellia bacterium]|nr:glycogen synthase GlgA [Blastocatellia bacterium]
MKILIAASEAVPYAKTGGLADVAGALPKALSRLGHDVRVLMPRYNAPKIIEAGHPVNAQLVVPFGGGERRPNLYVDRSGEVPFYFVDAPEYFARGGLYGEHDDGERFAFFSRSIVEFANSFDGPYDIIHLNDWMTGLVPVYLKTTYAGHGGLAQARTLFTIHNMAFHGTFGRGLLAMAGLPDWLYQTEGGIEFYGEASSLKGGIVFSDAVSTVSPRYALEIQTPEFGERFDGLLRRRSHDLFGILNGVDYDEWNPAADTYTAARYSPADLGGKRECKLDLLTRFGLPADPDRPLIGCISRLSDQKGFDILLPIIGNVLDRGAVFVLLGSGAEFYERAFQSLKDARPGQVGVYLGYSNELAHKIEAGADMFLMPSRFEPCGLNQMYSLKYGTVPIVRAAGGLDDTIDNFDRTAGRGNGFKFYDYDSGRLLEKIYEALLVYASPNLWRTLMLNGMNADFSWDRSARRYVEVYEKLAQQRAAARV